MDAAIVRRMVAVLWAVILCLTSAIAPASEMTGAADFKAVQSKIIELGKTYGPKNVLLVFDLDNTLLTANQPLGSDPWYNWQ
jgi:hypothetical protein